LWKNLEKNKKRLVVLLPQLFIFLTFGMQIQR